MDPVLMIVNGVASVWEIGHRGGWPGTALLQLYRRDLTSGDLTSGDVGWTLQ